MSKADDIKAIDNAMSAIDRIEPIFTLLAKLQIMIKNSWEDAGNISERERGRLDVLDAIFDEDEKESLEELIKIYERVQDGNDN